MGNEILRRNNMTNNMKPGTARVETCMSCLGSGIITRNGVEKPCNHCNGLGVIYSYINPITGRHETRPLVIGKGD